MRLRQLISNNLNPLFNSSVSVHVSLYVSDISGTTRFQEIGQLPLSIVLRNIPTDILLIFDNGHSSRTNRILPDVTGSGKFNMAAYKLVVSIYRLVDERRTADPMFQMSLKTL